MTNNYILEEDLLNIFSGLSQSEKAKFHNSSILLTGCGGFLGYYFIHFFTRFRNELGIKKIIGLVNFLVGNKDWLKDIESKYDFFNLYDFNIINDDIGSITHASEATFIIHMASIGSPTFYRIYPVETVDEVVKCWFITAVL